MSYEHNLSVQDPCAVASPRSSVKRSSLVLALLGRHLACNEAGYLVTTSSLRRTFMTKMKLKYIVGSILWKRSSLLSWRNHHVGADTDVPGCPAPPRPTPAARADRLRDLRSVCESVRPRACTDTLTPRAGPLPRLPATPRIRAALVSCPFATMRFFACCFAFQLPFGHPTCADCAPPKVALAMVR